MPRAKLAITYAHAPVAAVEDAIGRLGANIQVARVRRRWPQALLAERAGITRATLAAIEKGRLGTGIGAYASVLWALGLERDIALLASGERDHEGRTLEEARLPERARMSSTLDDDF